MQSRITWIQHREGKVSGAFLRPHQELNVSIRIHRDTEPLRTPIGHCGAKWSGTSLQAIPGAGRLIDRNGHGLEHFSWRTEV